MKYYSEQTKRIYDTEKDLKAAELELAKSKAAEKQKLEARKARAKEIEDAWNKVIADQEAYDKLVKAFVKDYGSYHATYQESNLPRTVSLSDLINRLFW